MSRDLNTVEFNQLMEYIISSLMQNGLKATTMDSIAAGRQISKRTLYEIFESKENMFHQAFEYFKNKTNEDLVSIFKNSGNVMEAIVRCFLYNRDLMSELNVEFIQDVHQYHQKNSHCNNLNNFKENHHPHFFNLYEILSHGIEEGFFRDDFNLEVHCKMLFIQMESLKRMQELFPADITLLEVYDTIIITFLRGLSTNKGLAELDRIIPSMNNISKKENK